MRTIYFPDAITGWIFFTLIMSVLAVASYTDQRWRLVPKWLTLPALGLGLLVNILRGCWLAAHEIPVWSFGRQGIALGGLDGLLFAITGALVGFGLLLVLWLLGTCGGGDVKLFAALGAWIGPQLVFLVLVVSLVFLIVYLIGHLGLQLLKGKTPTSALAAQSRKKLQASQPRKQRLMVKYSGIVAAATAVVLLWAFRIDCGLVKPVSGSAIQEARTHGR